MHASRIIPSILTAGLIGVSLAGLTACGSRSDATESNYTVPVTEASFEKEVKQADTPLVAVDFWATWCGPCKMIAPSLEELAKEYEGQVKIAKVDVDENPALAKEYEVRSIPTLYLFRDGKVIDFLIGAHDKEAYRKWFEENLPGRESASL